jgi:hypothetical protein
VLGITEPHVAKWVGPFAAALLICSHPRGQLALHRFGGLMSKKSKMRCLFSLLALTGATITPFAAHAAVCRKPLPRQRHRGGALLVPSLVLATEGGLRCAALWAYIVAVLAGGAVERWRLLRRGSRRRACPDVDVAGRTRIRHSNDRRCTRSDGLRAARRLSSRRASSRRAGGRTAAPTDDVAPPLLRPPPPLRSKAPRHPLRRRAVPLPPAPPQLNQVRPRADDVTCEVRGACR